MGKVDIHVERRLLLNVKVRISQLAVQLCVRPRDRYTDARQHVISCYPVGMGLVNLGANQNSVIVFFFLSPPLASSLLSIHLGPSHGVFVRDNLVSGSIRLHGPRRSSS